MWPRCTDASTAETQLDVGSAGSDRGAVGDFAAESGSGAAEEDEEGDDLYGEMEQTVLPGVSQCVLCGACDVRCKVAPLCSDVCAGLQRPFALHDKATLTSRAPGRPAFVLASVRAVGKQRRRGAAGRGLRDARWAASKRGRRHRAGF